MTPNERMNTLEKRIAALEALMRPKSAPIAEPAPAPEPIAEPETRKSKRHE